MPEKRPIETDGESVIVRIRVQPGAATNSLYLGADGELRARVTARPVDGGANRALLSMLAKAVGVAKGSVSLQHGSRSRDKTLRIEGVSEFVVRKGLGIVP